jgi:hypothetical protein
VFRVAASVTDLLIVEAEPTRYAPNEEATTMNEGKSVRSRRVGSGRGVCGVARLTWNTQAGSS